jgi:hypothetical protein
MMMAVSATTGQTDDRPDRMRCQGGWVVAPIRPVHTPLLTVRKAGFQPWFPWSSLPYLEPSDFRYGRRDRPDRGVVAGAGGIGDDRSAARLVETRTAIVHPVQADRPDRCVVTVVRVDGLASLPLAFLIPVEHHQVGVRSPHTDGLGLLVLG